MAPGVRFVRAGSGYDGAMSSMITPGMSRFRALVRRVLPFTASEADPALEDEGPIGEVSPHRPATEDASHRRVQE